MKTFLFAVAASLLVGTAAYAMPETPTQDELRPADELAQTLGLDENLNMEEGVSQDYFVSPPPPPHPHPPGPPPHPPGPPPHPYPPGPPHPYPPGPPPYYPPYPYQYECGSEDVYGTAYWSRGSDPRWVQADVHRYCVNRSNGPCRDLGCRPY